MSDLETFRFSPEWVSGHEYFIGDTFTLKYKTDAPVDYEILDVVKGEDGIVTLKMERVSRG